MRSGLIKVWSAQVLARRILVLMLGLLTVSAPAWAVSTSLSVADSEQPKIEQAQLKRLFPDIQNETVEREGRESPPFWIIKSNGQPVGYIASTFETINSIGYSGQPLDVLVGITTDARISGALLVRHNEPVLTLGISDADLVRYLDGFKGYDLKSPPVQAFKDSSGLPTIIARATVTTGVIRDAVLRTARLTATRTGLIKTAAAAVDRLRFEPRTWKQLVEDNALQHKLVTFAEATQQFGQISAPLSAQPGIFLNVWVALLDPPTIGQNLLGRKTFERIFAGIASGDSALLLASSGLHSHRGTGYLQSGYFDRIEVIQGEHTIKLKKEDYLRIDELALSDAPKLNEMSIFRLSGASGFDPAKPFRVELLAERSRDDGSISAIRMPVAYQLPDAFLAARAAPVEEEPLWVAAWERKPIQIALTGIMIVLVAAAFFAQEWFVRQPRLWHWSRIGFLSVTLVVLGWGMNGQLSIVQVIAFVHSLFNGLKWETFLIEPVIFVLWSFVALGLLFWGRGTYCGWLCPFGALQELLNEGAKRLGVKQIEVPFHIQERLWAIKYTLFMLILGLSFYSMDYALKLAEIEPFKTVISMRFQRAWPFVALALLLLVAGLFIERFFCRYLCPLGAALAIPAKIKLFDWLHRRPQCGRECRFCETQCTVGAIDTLGRINPNECVLCLRCQVILNDNAQCIVLKRRTGRVEGQPQPNRGA